jgi:hypothetical protein
MSIETPDGVLDVTNATLRVPQIEVQGTSVTTSLSTLSNVGVGTGTPGGRLHVYGPDAKTLLQSTSNTANVEIGGPSGAIVDLKGPFTDDYDLRIQSLGDGGTIATTGNVNHIRLASTGGYTGFGTATPQYKIDVQGVKGVDAVSNPIAHNPVFLYDDQESTTTFSGTAGGDGASRNTTSKYLELNSLTDNATGYVYWPVHMPNSWTAEFDHYIAGGDGGESLSFSFFNTSAPTTTGNHGGYRLAIAEFYGGSPAAKVVLYYQGSEVAQKNIVGGIPTSSWNKVVVNYNRGSISLSFNGRSAFSYEATENADSYTGRYSGFIGKTGLRNNYHRVRNVKCTSGTNWVYATGSNASTLAYLSGNVGIGTDAPTQMLEVTANVKATHFIGDGGLLSNIATTLNSIVNQGNTTSNTVQFTNEDTGIVATGNIVVQEGGFFVGDGSKLVNIPTDFESIIINGNTTSNVVFFANTNVAIQASGNIVVDSDSFFIGNGGLLSNIATTLEDISNQGNTTSNTIQFTNSSIGFVTTANVGIANSAPTNHLSVGSNLHVNDTGSNVLTVRGNVSANTLTLGDFQVVASYGLNHVTAENNQTGDTLVLTNATKGIDASSNIDLGGQLNFDSNVKIVGGGTGTFMSNLRVATVASNVMTYDQTTGEVMDSGGLFTNRLAVVSEQPPGALTGDTTTIQGHGKYVATSSSATGNGAAYKAFDKSVDGWQTSNDRYNSSGDLVSSASLGGVSGEWLKIELPYKAVLRHYSLKQSEDQTLDAQLKQFPKDFRILASNDNTTWTTIHSETAVERPTSVSDPAKIFVVDAPVAYKYYAIVVEKINAGANNGRAQIGELRLFTESFSVDGGIVTTTAASGLETGFTEHPVAPMTDFHTYVEGHGTYEASASSYDSSYSLYPWEAFDDDTSTRWTVSTSDDNYNVSTGEWDQTAIDASPDVFTSDVGGTRYHGHWLQIKLPYTVTLSHTNIYPQATARAPVDGVILGSNDGEHWYKLTEFSGKTYTASTWTRIDVNATTPYQYFRMCATKNGGDSKLELTEWRLFSATGVTKMDNVLISGELAVDGGALQTSHIKWPKVPLKAAKSEGYVASASSTYKTLDQWQAWHAFENKSQYGGNYPAWISGENTFINSTGLPDTANCATFDNLSCEWIQIKQPTAIQLSSFKFKSRYLSSTPVSGAMYGSNDDFASYDKLTSFSDNTELEPIINVQSTEKYNAFRLVVTATTTAPTTDIDELQLFESTLGVGTSATTAKLTVDGGLGLAKGSQVFAGSDVVTEFPKHDRPLTKYPEVTMTVATTGGYTASASREPTNYSAPAWHAFGGNNNSWETIGGSYDQTTGAWTGSVTMSTTVDGTSENGDWIQIELPRKITVTKMRYQPSLAVRAPAYGILAASNDGTTWTALYNISNATYTDSVFVDFAISNTTAYKYYRLIATSLYTNNVYNVNRNRFSTAELEYYGTEEGDESVDVVHRSIPNTPGQQQLAVYYEARDPNSYSFADSTKVYDLSGSGVTGTITGNNGFDAEYNAWVFDGSGDYISTTSSGLGTGGAFDHSFAFWFKINRNITNNDYVVTFGEESLDNMIAVNISGNSLIHFDNWGRGVITGDIVRLGTWYHVACTHTGSATGNIYNQLIYVNGVRQTTSPTGTGTLAFTSNRITIGARPGTDNSDTPTAFLDGAVSSVRFFKGKVLNPDQVRELYDYDAERFGHRTNLVALHKGNLGVGVAQPTARLEVAGADGLQEYPPKAMTGYETYMEGHGVFRASASSDYNTNKIWYAFDDNTSTHWHSALTYTVSNGNYNGSESLGGFDGEWISIEMPYMTKIEKISLFPRGGYTARLPENGVLIGSNNGSDWYLIKQWYGLSFTIGIDNLIEIGATSYYLQYALVTQKLKNDINGNAFNIGEWRLFGTPAPSSLEDGHLTLGKALTLPRVSGHPAGAETPRAESLVVHYDTTVDSVVSGSTVVDISGTGNNGTLTNGAAYSSTDRALTFDGVDDYIELALTTASGDWIHSISCWAKFDSFSSKNTIFQGDIGGTTINSTLNFRTNENGTVAVAWYGNNQTWSKILETNVWYHIILVYPGGGANLQRLYVDGLEISVSSSASTSTLDVTYTDFAIGTYDVSSSPLGGSISNFKLWNVALTAEEVAMEYALGRTGKSINLTDTALCLGGTVPRSQLDVRGVARFHQIDIHHDTETDTVINFRHYLGSAVKPWEIGQIMGVNPTGANNSDFKFATNRVVKAWIDSSSAAPTVEINNFTGQHRTFIKDVPFSKANELEGLIVSSDQNKYIKMSGGIEVGSNAITTNESLPVVSLSNVVADKRCFGVISASEDPETRQDRYGNIVSVSVKEVGDTRVYINSVGEGAMWVTDINGPLESGDYITTSNVAGYGQKQDSEFLANYTVAKITMDCDFDPQDQPIQRIKQSNVIETHYTGVVSVTRGVPHEFVTTTVTANDEWSNVSISPSDVTYEEWSNLEANVQNTYTLTYTQTSNVVYDVKYTKTTTANVTQSDPWDKVYVDPPNVSYEEWSNLDANVQNTYTLTYTMTTKVEATEAIYSNLSTEDKEFFVPTYYQMVEQRVDAEYPGAVKHETITDRLVNVLDEHGQLQWEDDPSGATEKAYKIRYLDASGAQTDEANAVHTAAFVGCTYHCG